MEHKPESLERKLGKPDWKQWLPIYGIYQIIKDSHNNKPTMVDERDSAKYWGMTIYQSVSIFGTVGGIGYLLAERL